jgi:dTDP-4-dehydrorhamnose 3,5-epimerase
LDLEIKEYPDLPGIRVVDLNILPDERGFFMETLSAGWKEFLGEDPIVQINTSFNYPGIIRAWHRHLRGQVDYFYLVDGAMKICAYDDRPESAGTMNHMVQITVSSRKPQVVRIPGYYWHGMKNVCDRPSTLIYCVTRVYDRLNPDEQRRPWNDSTIVDKNTQRPFDWNAPPHK